MIKKILITVLILLWSLAATACRGEIVIGDGQEQVMEFANYGRMVAVEQELQSVVTIGPNCTEIFIALGLADKVVGNCCNDHSQGSLPEFAEAYEQIPELTYGLPTLEAVVGSGADFVYAIDWAFSGDFTVEALENYGITVYMCAATDYDELWQEIADLGSIFGAEQVAADYIAEQQKLIADAKNLAQGKEKQRVLVFDAGGDTVYTAGAANFENVLLGSAGAVNIFADMEKAWGAVSYEEVLIRDPQWIVVHDYDIPTARQKIEAIKANDILAQLDCVQQEKFIIIPLECALPGSRSGYTAKLFADAIWGE